MMNGHHMYSGKHVKAGKKFTLINLNKPNFQLDLLADISHEQLEELFNAGFSLAKREASDFIESLTAAQPEIHQQFMKKE